MEIEKLHEKYPWLNITTSIEEYVEPKYYDDLLKDYIFDEKADIQFFEEFLETLSNKKDISVVELGCGSGRATSIFLEHFKEKNSNLKLIDLSSRMLNFCKNKFIGYNKIGFIKSDSIEFLDKSDELYDVIFSLWSFSHSVHQVLNKKGLNDGKKYIQSVIEKFIIKNMKKSSNFFLIHFDSLSDEQRILMRQWKKVYPIYNNTEFQSPSKLLIDEILKSLKERNIISFESNHYKGKEIIYSSDAEALEIFLNFHMESYFNESPILPEVIDELLNYFKSFTDKNGLIKIRPGCFVYKINKK